MRAKNGKDNVPLAPIATESSHEVKTGTWRTLRPVTDRDKCSKCLTCWKYCPDLAVTIEEDGFTIINYDFCKGCGICANECPKKCIVMVRQELE